MPAPRATVERVKKFWAEHPDASLTECQQQAKVSRGCARKYHPNREALKAKSGKPKPAEPATVDPAPKEEPAPAKGHDLDRQYPAKKDPPKPKPESKVAEAAEEAEKPAVWRLIL